MHIGPDMLSGMVAPKETPISPNRGEIQQLKEKEIGHAFENVTRQVLEAHRKELETDNPALMVEIDPELKGKKFSDTEIQAQAAKITARRKIENDPDNIKNEEQFLKMPVETEEQQAAKQLAINKETARRNLLIELQKTYETIHTISACENAISPQRITDAVTAKNKVLTGYTKEIEAERVKAYSTVVGREDLTPEELDQIFHSYVEEKKLGASLLSKEKETQEKKDYVARYTDGAGNYHKINRENGEPISDQTVRLEEVFENVTNEAHYLAENDKDDSGQPSILAKEIKPFADKLDFDPQKGKFVYEASDAEKALRENEAHDEIMKRLDGMRNYAMNFCAQGEYFNSEKEEIVEASLNAYSQLAICQEDYIQTNPPELREIMIRQALGSFQNFREKLTVGKQDPENKFPDYWKVIQNEVDNYPNKEIKLDKVTKYIKEQIEKGDGGKWDENIGEVIKKGRLSEAMVTMLAAGHCPEKYQFKIFDKSTLLKDFKLKNFLINNRKVIYKWNRSVFGSEEQQKKMKKDLENILPQIPEDKWGTAIQTIIGILGMAAISQSGVLGFTGEENQERTAG